MLTPTQTAALTAAAQQRTDAEKHARRAVAAFAETVAWVHAQAGVTEIEIAQALGVSQQRISQIAQAGRQLSADRLY